jgi:hypothetical protein
LTQVGELDDSSDFHLESTLNLGMVSLVSLATPFANDQQWSKDQAGGQGGAGQAILF